MHAADVGGSAVSIFIGGPAVLSSLVNNSDLIGNIYIRSCCILDSLFRVDGVFGASTAVRCQIDDKTNIIFYV